MSTPAYSGSDRSLPLNTITLDLRSPAGKSPEGYFRLVVNAISDREGRLRRLGGWRALSLGAPGDRVNEDLHDQLLTNVVSPTVKADLPLLHVVPPIAAPMLPATSSVASWTVSVSGLVGDPRLPFLVPLATISVTKPTATATGS